MSAPIPLPKKAPFRFANFEAVDAEDLGLMSEIWLSDMCAAAWSTKEAHKVGAYIAAALETSRTADCFVRDFETALNLQPEEVARALKLLKLFGRVDDFTIDKGLLVASVRVGYMQKLKLLEAKERYRRLTEGEAESALTVAAAALRSVAAAHGGSANGGAAKRDNVVELEPRLQGE